MKPKSTNKGRKSEFLGIDPALMRLIPGCLGTLFTIGFALFIITRNTKRYDKTELLIFAVIALVILSALVSSLIKRVQSGILGHWLKEIGIYANDESSQFPFDSLPANTRRIRPYAVFRITLPTTLKVSFRLAGERSKNHFHHEQSYTLTPGRHVISPPGWFQLLEPKVGDGWRFTVTVNEKHSRGHKVFITEETAKVLVNEDGEISPRLHQAVEGDSSDLSLDDLLNVQQGDQSS